MPQLRKAMLSPGTMISKRYRIEQLIDNGERAYVYRATDMTLGYERAIKEVSDPDPGVRTQFRLEAELLINSKHSNVVKGFHLIEDMGRLFLIMNYVHGKDLEELLNESLTKHQRTLDEAQVLRWAIDICDALDKMHNLKVPVIHRNVKTTSVMITPENQPVLVGFGIAKLQQRGATMPAAQNVSPGFSPPEQYMAKGRTDPRTDIYGLGATLYTCLTGKDPPEAPGRLLAQTGAGGGAGMQLVPPRKLNPHISETTDRLIVRALELSPNNRQQSAHELEMQMQEALQRLSGDSVGATGNEADSGLEQPPLRVFLSHSSLDKLIADRIVHRLRKAGVDVWYDEHNLGAGHLKNEIQRELEQRRIFILLLSKAAFASSWVKDETDWADDLRRRDRTRLILPVTVKPIEQADFSGVSGWLFLNSYKRIEAPDYQPYSEAEMLERIVRALGITPIDRSSRNK